MGIDKYPIFRYNKPRSKQNMALWCSRLARQPVTLEVDGSSPFGVAKKEVIHPDDFFFVILKNGLEQSNATVRGTVACRRSRRRQHIYFHRKVKMQTSPFGVTAAYASADSQAGRSRRRQHIYFHRKVKMQTSPFGVAAAYASARMQTGRTSWKQHIYFRLRRK